MPFAKSATLLSILAAVAPSSGAAREIVTPIHAVQGAGATSPFAGTTVTVSGVVTGDFQAGDADDQRDLGGFFLQELTPDDNPGTSEGIFVQDGADPDVDVAAGDRVTVTGTIREIDGETRVEAIVVNADGQGSIRPAVLELPLPVTVDSRGRPMADLERFEGMLVEVGEPVAITDLYPLERYGEIGLAGPSRLFQYTNGSDPHARRYQQSIRDAASWSLLMNDGSLRQNPGQSAYDILTARQPSRGGVVRTGDVVMQLVANVRFGRAAASSGREGYRLEPVAAPLIGGMNDRPAAPPQVGGRISVASFNVLNYFTTIDEGSPVCGPRRDLGCRGADSAAEFERQHAKLVLAIGLLDADVVGLMELENNGDRAIGHLVDGLNDGSDGDAWSWISTGTIGTDAIAVGLVYRRDVLRPAGEFAILDSSVDDRFIDNRNRPTLAQTFEALDGTGRFTLAVNHLKSKGSPCDDLGDPDTGDGQANCNGTRTAAARALADWLAADPTGSDDPDMLIIGDLNAYLREDPVVALERAGFVNLLGQAFGGFTYTYVFAGQAGALDHALASPSLATQVAGIAEWHINADEAGLLDYNLDFGRDPDWFDADSPFRASDHDPVIIGIDPERTTQ